MSRSLLLSILAVACAAAGCAVSADGDPPGEAAETEAPPEEPITLSGHGDSSQDPCQMETQYVIQGYVVHVPVACDPWQRDEGDPPPDAITNPDAFVNPPLEATRY